MKYSLSVIEQKSYSIFKKFFEDLKGDMTYSRLGKVFMTERNKYFYDMGTGKVLACEENVFHILKSLTDTNQFDDILNLDMKIAELLEGLEILKETVEKENILKAPKIKSFYGADEKVIQNALENRVEMVTLEVTERCNLRCDYCIYQNCNEQFRKYGNADMTEVIAKKAIDFGLEHSSEVKESYILSFYGGEPLLKYDLIKECVKYAEDKVKDRKLHFSITSNMTLLTEEMAKYFAEKGFSFTVSLDGGQRIHDEHRKFSDGTGSFEKTIRGLKYLVDAYGSEAGNLISINAVVSEPCTFEQFDEIQDFFDHLEWLPKSCDITYAYVDYGFPTEEEMMENRKFIQNGNHSELVPLDVWSRARSDKMCVPENSDEKLFSNTENEKELAKIHGRRIMDQPMHLYPLNSNCIPGVQRLYVSARGNFIPCEKIGEGPIIGNIIDGYDYDAIMKFYFKDYIEKSLPVCNKCWSAQICGVCYAQCVDSNGVNMKVKEAVCDFRRYLNERAFVYYYEQLERDPQSLNYLNELQ